MNSAYLFLKIFSNIAGFGTLFALSLSLSLSLMASLTNFFKVSKIAGYPPYGGYTGFFILPAGIRRRGVFVMKKIVVALALSLAVSSAAFALPEFKLSFGGGALFSSVFGNGIKADIGDGKITNTMIGAGAYGFFDATNAEVDFAFLGGGGKSKMSDGSRSMNFSTTFAALDLALLGKYPFSLGRITLFPLLGFDYLIVVSAKAEGVKEDKPTEASSFGFDFGAGLDFPLTDHLYLRGEFLYAIRLPSKFQKDLKDDYGPDGIKYILGNGPTLKVAVGYSL
jgi:opacity protein-like surface antigen